MLEQKRLSRIRRCLVCGLQFDHHGSKKKHCSDSCARKNRKDAKLKRALGRPHGGVIRMCPQCHATFVARMLDIKKGPRKGQRKRQVYCSRECGWASMRIRREEKPHSVKSCGECGGPILGKRAKSAAKYCSKRCMDISYYRPRVNAQRKFPRAFSCLNCGGDVSTDYGDRRRKYCSVACGKRYRARMLREEEKTRRRIGPTADVVDPFIIFERCGWVCSACGVSTPRWLRGTTSPFAPELDHVHPVSRGGGSEEGNLQLLCRRCNALKSNKMGWMAA